MKRKILLVSIFLLITPAFCILPVSANNGVTYRANGTLDSYEDAWSAEIVNGYWRIIIKGSNVDFRAFYRELNKDLIENSPVGTVDHFWMSFTQIQSISIDADVRVIEGTLHFKKKWWTLWGTIEFIEFEYEVEMRINSSEMFIDMPDPDPPHDPPQNFDYHGTTRTIHY